MATSSPEAMLAPARVRGGKGPASISRDRGVPTIQHLWLPEAVWGPGALSETEKKPGVTEEPGSVRVGTPKASCAAYEKYMGGKEIDNTP